ncbi:unnamed protein product [Chondrus crispus]|uniref:Uncharacterized protein n=1 Tax=Chondrus crispus TaxID=2769 RepID=R7Q0D1_CHOCR|nr:unnamed protein product [Chondrus crispus]CDF32107.1 unnamed protein product [Chondrus crispus]|eukprot:XP_005711772.1 unnamed protein product [Chondrus crispus]
MVEHLQKVRNSLVHYLSIALFGKMTGGAISDVLRGVYSVQEAR